jgi:hypothetical protein
MQFPYKIDLNRVNRLTYDKLIYHKYLSDFFPRYPNTHLGNTLLVDDKPYKTWLNSSFNAIFVESYEYMPKEHNYLIKTFLPYLDFVHYYGLSVPTFVEFYPFGTIKSIKENDVRFRVLFKKCNMACFTSFYKNHLALINSPNIFLLLFPSNSFLDFLISLIYMVSLFPNFHNYYFILFLDYQCIIS